MRKRKRKKAKKGNDIRHSEKEAGICTRMEPQHVKRQERAEHVCMRGSRLRVQASQLGQRNNTPATAAAI